MNSTLPIFGKTVNQPAECGLGLLQAYLEKERKISLIEDIDAPDLNGWLAHLRTTPGSRGKPRAERSIQTYARSARAFFHWLVRRELIARNPFDRVTFPKVGKPLIQTIDADEFERLLLACTPPHEAGPFAERAAVRNRAILWVLYDTGIRVSELCGLRLPDFDRKHGVLTVTGKGSKERRIALGSNCLRNLLYYLDRYRPDEDELAEWSSAGEDHLFLSETRLPLTKNGVTLLFKRIKQRAGITDKRISPHIFRHSFAIRYGHLLFHQAFLCQYKAGILVACEQTLERDRGLSTLYLRKADLLHEAKESLERDLSGFNMFVMLMWSGEIDHQQASCRLEHTHNFRESLALQIIWDVMHHKGTENHIK
jgi:site-specific recombinase XerD